LFVPPRSSLNLHFVVPLTQASSDKKQLDVGANLFIGSLDENVDERLLYDTFSAFGMMATTAKVRRQNSLTPPITPIHVAHASWGPFPRTFY
jgi:hypothetical protein